MPVMPVRPIKFEDGYCRVDLGNGLFALVDICDLDIVSGRHWNTCRGKKHPPYAATNIRQPDGRYARVKMHRAILCPPEGAIVDHINGDSLDNRRANLRLTDPTGSAQNTTIRRDNKSGIRGVSWDKKANKWRVQIRGRSGVKHIQTCASKDEAAELYRNLSLELHGEFSIYSRPLPSPPSSES